MTTIPALVQAAFEPYRDPAAASGMSGYMRHMFPFLGIPSPRRRQLQKEALAGHTPPGESKLVAAVRELWAMPEREYQYTAVDLLSANARVLTPAFLPVARELIRTKSWWDTVDALATHVVGAIVVRHREEAARMDAWVRDENIWIARTAILHQLRFKSATDAARLFATASCAPLTASFSSARRSAGR